MSSEKIINGFCYLKGNVVIFVDLITEKSHTYTKESFNDYDIDDTCIFLANREGATMTLLYKYDLASKASGIPIKAAHRSTESLIDVCYSVCIELFQKDDTITE